jgi:uncharacterized membrane protein YbhN (UPF0104 family)
LSVSTSTRQAARRARSSTQSNRSRIAAARLQATRKSQAAAPTVPRRSLAPSAGSGHSGVQHPSALAPFAATALALAKRYKRVLQAGVLALILAFLASSIARSWSQLSSYSWHVHWGLLLAAFALLVAQELSFALIWRAILRRLGSRLDIVSAERIFMGSEFVRYIPGNVWHVIMRVLWAERRGVPKTVGFASMVIELATRIGSAALLFAATLFFWPDAQILTGIIPRNALVAAGVVGVPLLLLGLHPRLLGAALNAGLRLLKREPARIGLTYRDLLVITGYWMLSWLVAGAGFYLLVLALAPTAPTLAGLLLASGVYALGWDIGFLSFVTPSGLGFREVAIAFLLSHAGFAPPGAGLATVIAVLARLLATGAEVTCIAGAHLVPGADPRPAVESVARD